MRYKAQPTSKAGLYVYMGTRVKPESPRRERLHQPAQTTHGPSPACQEELWEKVFARDNLLQALKRVEHNKGAPGPDGMKVEELRPYLMTNWTQIRQKLDQGTYKPQPVKRTQIPKSDGGLRNLGVPAVVDRMICQAIAQTLSELYEPDFSNSSYGFRPNRSAHMAVNAAKAFVEEGNEWAVSVDLDSFFDRVNHDVLMSSLGRKVRDKRLLKLVGSYLRAGVVDGHRKLATTQGTPQGSPLSPVLANILLNELDQELDQRGHRFVRYADDLRIYVGSKRAGQRVMESVGQFLAKRLKLSINRGKSKVASFERVHLLGFGFYRHIGKLKVRIDPKAVKKAKGKLRKLAGRSRGISLTRWINEVNRYTVGFTAYFALASDMEPFETLDIWLRRRGRQFLWKKWKCSKARRRNLVAAGMPFRRADRWSRSGLGYWRVAGSPILTQGLPIAFWEQAGLRGFCGPYLQRRGAM